ncbi:MAG: alpha/beta hydrolase [Verrucomicrobiales bacterium]
MKATFLFAGLVCAGLSAAPLELDLYQGDPPGAPLSAEADVTVRKEGDPIVRLTHVQKPGLRVFLPPKEKATGAAVVICPGGAYRILAIEHEGDHVAQWLGSIGVAGIVCKYRVSDKVGTAYQHPVPLLDARQAMRLARQHAAEWKLDPRRVGVMGFSAGGHLASCVLTLFQQPLPGEDADAFSKMDHRPDFGALIYPVITMTEAYGHRGSRDYLLGKNPAAEALRLLDTHLQVTDKTPPSFLVGTFDDTAVPPLNAISFYKSMCEHKVPGELHVWEKGGHGFGMLSDRGDAATEWPARFEKWMRSRGLLDKR